MGKPRNTSNSRGAKRNSQVGNDYSKSKTKSSKFSKESTSKNSESRTIRGKSKNGTKMNKSKLSLLRNNKVENLKRFGKLGKFKNVPNQHTDRPDKESKDKPWKRNSTKTDDNTEIEVVSAQSSTSFSLNSMLQENDWGESEADELNTRKMVSQQNRKKRQAGGFQSMGLSHPVFTGVLRRGYKVPTPIQRKTIPLIMEGQDVVAMARTGSGKTAAFLIPMFERLITHNATAGARALILSPTRELALQTLKFTKELGKYTQLRAAVILGGDRMDDQFEAMHNNPDIIIATPGRLMHVIVEMEVKLRQIEYVVFDEADRLFEMGFKEQLHEIIHRLPESRQTVLFSATLPKISPNFVDKHKNHCSLAIILYQESRQTVLFSATLPKMLVEFARAGLQDPTLIRLDVDSKLSEQLQTSYFLCRREDKPASLIYLLQNVVTNEQQTVIFCATMHHVEYINQILDKISVPYAYIYSSMDQTARKISIAKFTNKKCMVLVVTDIAARGIDIPMLDVVINYNFPAKSKLFVHRVGRVARAGRTGCAYSLVSPDEMANLLDLHLFLGRPLNLVPDDDSLRAELCDGYCGRVPQTVIDEGSELMHHWATFSQDFKKCEETANNAYKQYIKSRALPSTESVRRVKDLERSDAKIGIHPAFGKHSSLIENERRDLLSRMKCYKPNTTIFEINSTQKQQARPIMKMKREKHERVIAQSRAKILDQMTQKAATTGGEVAMDDGSTQQELEETFKVMIGTKNQKGRQLPIKDEENYLNYQPKDFRSEIGLSLKTSFEKEASSATLDLTTDSTSHMISQDRMARWDRKKKRFVQSGGNIGKNKKVKTEGGTWIKASYKANLYKDWLKRSKMADQLEDGGGSGSDDDDPTPQTTQPTRGISVLGTTKARWQNKVKKESLIDAGLQPTRTRGGKLKNTEQILKERKRKDKLVKFQKMRKKRHDRNRSRKK